ncbi:MAG: helix-turn-helix domain-containing protein [Acidobacteria bacterium]|nr:helix-turn-helix domain-containing protein [Acidobacteriota bacterium]
MHAATMVSMQTHSEAPTPSSSLQMLRPAECARVLGVSVATLWRWTTAGRFPAAYRLSPGVAAFDQTEVTDWLKKRRVSGAGKV